MPTYATHSRKSSGKYNPQPDYTPLYGIRLFGTESGFLLSFIAIILYSAARIYMSVIEQNNAGSIEIFAILGILSSILLLSGGFLFLLGTHIKRLPGIFLFAGLIMLIFADCIFCFCLIMDTMSEIDILGVIQSIFEVLFLISLLLPLITLLISCLKRRTSPNVGVFSTVISVFAVLLLLVRTLTTFASLSSALGTSFSWDQTSELTNEINWIMRSIPTDSAYAPDMYYARLFERITLVLMYASILPPVFRFASFFRQYNMQMDISAELPGGYKTVKEQKGNIYSSGRFDLMSTINSLRESEDSEKHSDDFSDDLEDAVEEDITGYCTPDYISGVDEPAEPFFAEPRPIIIPEPEPVVYYNTNMLDPNYGTPIDPPSSDSADEPPAQNEASRTDSGAYRVKLTPKSSFPEPDDDSIWNNYTD